jgi:D-xylose transport system substrate-binding protein
MQMLKTLLAAGLTVAALTTSALAQVKVGMSWANYQEERWKIDEEGLKQRL